MNTPDINLKNGEQLVVVGPDGQVVTAATLDEAKAKAEAMKRQLNESGTVTTAPEIKQQLFS